MIRICHIISGDLWAGAEVMASELIREIKNDASISITAIVLNEGMLSRNLREGGVETFVLSEKQLSFCQICLRVRTLIRNGNFEVIHSHRYKENLLAFLATRWLKPTLLFSTMHGMPENNLSPKACFVQNLNVFLLKHFFIANVSVSRDLRETMAARFSFKKYKMPIIHNGVSLHPTDSRKQCDSNCIIGSAGRFVPVKNYELIIEMARRCRNEPDVSFELAGDGPDLPMLQDRIRSLGVESTFKLWGHQDSMAPFYRRWDIFINTSLHEGIPMTILEAMSYGIPVVASRTGGIPEIIQDGVDGFLVPPGNVDIFVEKCLLLAKNFDLRKRVGFQARRKVESCFSIKATAAKYKVLYLNESINIIRFPRRKLKG
jgi:L-malate glycosyltransferase